MKSALTPVSAESEAGRELDRIAHETLLFWGLMLNSWVGVDAWPVLPEPLVRKSGRKEALVPAA
jgi:hypothetical protein